MTTIITLRPNMYLLERETNKIFRIFEVMQDEYHTCLIEPINSSQLKNYPKTAVADEIGKKKKYKVITSFNIEYLNPFDLVLVRNYNGNKWQISQFGYCDNLGTQQQYAITTNGNSNMQCMPYCHITKPFLGTKKNPTGFYRQSSNSNPDENTKKKE